MNVLTFDVEEWFHLLDFDATRNESDWGKFDVRIYENVDRVLKVLEDTNTSATFFVIGWIAKTYPDVVKRISEKFEIGSHTMTHQLVWQQAPAEFKADVEVSVKRLEDITGKKVTAFRAPGFSIRESEAWAFEALSELGITTDCSVFPAPASHGGMPSYSAQLPSTIEYNGIRMREFPVPTKSIAGRHFAFNGGGYFRLFPYAAIKRWSLEHPDYLLSYIHPRDLDSGQPMLEGLPAFRKFKSYVGLKGAEKKLRRYLTDFKFTDVQTAASQIDWDKMPVVRLG